MLSSVMFLERVGDSFVERQRASFRFVCGKCGVGRVEEGHGVRQLAVQLQRLLEVQTRRLRVGFSERVIPEIADDDPRLCVSPQSRAMSAPSRCFSLVLCWSARAVAMCPFCVRAPSSVLATYLSNTAKRDLRRDRPVMALPG
jgi:hypothetical protein